MRRLNPILVPRVWGGDRLAEIFSGYADGGPADRGPVGEAWLLSDHPAGRTLDDAGRTLGDLVGPGGWFPVLVKLLHAKADLSVQVHPNDTQAALAGDLGKTEGWLILEAEADARVCYGVRAGSREEMLERIRRREFEDLWQYRPVRAGEYYPVPAGTVHALCAGILALEVQQASDTTYRLYDYDRPGIDGRPRALHVDEGVHATAFPQPVLPDPPRAWEGVDEAGNGARTLDDNEYFSLSAVSLQGEWRERAGEEEALCFVGLEGDISPEGFREPVRPYPVWLFEPGETAVLSGTGRMARIAVPLRRR